MSSFFERKECLSLLRRRCPLLPLLKKGEERGGYRFAPFFRGKGFWLVITILLAFASNFLLCSE